MILRTPPAAAVAGTMAPATEIRPMPPVAVVLAVPTAIQPMPADAGAVAAQPGAPTMIRPTLAVAVGVATMAAATAIQPMPPVAAAPASPTMTRAMLRVVVAGQARAKFGDAVGGLTANPHEMAAARPLWRRRLFFCSRSAGFGG